MKPFTSRKSQVFIVGIVIAVTLGLVSSYILLQYLYDDKSAQEHLGTYESAMMDSLIEGDQAFIYLDEASRLASDDALKEFSENGGLSIIPESGEEDVLAPCGRYVYALWNTESAECYPNYRETFSPYLDSKLASIMSKAQDDRIRKDIDYTFSYDASGDITIAHASTKDQYTFYVFKTREYAEQEDLKEYIENKETYSGSFIWPVDDNYRIASCFGYRGVVSAGGSKKGSTNHPGIDISAAKGTPVLAVADGTVSQLQPSWGALIIDHGGGLKTTYGHMSKYEVNKGDIVKQGQKIGEVGDKASPSHFHLHFEVIMSTLDHGKNFQGVPAFVSIGRGTNVNPLCFISKSYLAENNIKLDINMDSKACKAICNKDGSVCATDVSDAPYKFCGIYGASESAGTCQSTTNIDWKISNFVVSSRSLSADQKLTITTTIENPSKDCVTVHAAPRILLVGAGADAGYVPESSAIDIYPLSEDKKYMNLQLECVFTSDDARFKELRDAKRCVLRAPGDDTKLNYKIIAGALDAKGRSYDAKNSMQYDIDVSKAKSTELPSFSTPKDKVELTADQQKILSRTKTNLEKLGLMPYIEEVCTKEGVPKEIFLGLVTQESNGVVTAGSDVGAKGLTQFMKDTYNDNNLKFEDKCTWDQFQTDAKCQVRAGVAYLKWLYLQRQGKTYYYKCSLHCPTGPKGSYIACNSCTTVGRCIGPVNKVYVNWPAALRAYNGGGWTAPDKIDGSGCGNQPDYEYVEKVMTYAAAWGYAGTDSITEYKQESKVEIEKGIIGKYSITPSFATSINFDMTLLEKLNVAMMDTSDACRGKDETCILDQVKKFNTEISQSYIDKGRYVELSMDCESGDDERAANSFVQAIEQCAASTDTDCQCALGKGSTLLGVKSSEGLTSFTTDDGYIVESYHTFYDKDGNIAQDIKISSSADAVYKGKDYLKFRDVNDKLCEPVKNKFKLCLKTNYTIPKLNDGKISSENITLRFAITLRDNEPPAPISGLSVSNKDHSRNSIIVRWMQSPEKDIRKYIVYLADSKEQLERATAEFDDLHRRDLDVREQGYEVYQQIDMTSPRCEQLDSEKGKYCRFLYKAVSKDDKDSEIELFNDKLYFINSTGEFLYILEGNDEYNGLVSGSEKYVAVVAMDLSGNQIDNIAGNQKITFGANAQSIVVKDLLEPSFVNANILTESSGTVVPYLSGDISAGNIVVTWEKPLLYIDGTEISDAHLTYDIYDSWELCESDYCSVSAPYAPIHTEDDVLMATLPIDTLMLPARLGVIARTSNAGYMHASTRVVG